MNYFDHPEFSGHEHVSFVHDPATGLKAIIAIHSLRGGFCGGGIRFFPYADSGEALYDVLRLSKGMTYKAALAGLPFGGGKSVIIGDPRTLKSPGLLEAFGRAVDRLGGKYICAEDMGMTPDDMLDIRKATPWVTGLPGKSGDTSPLTGFGVYRALQAAAARRLGRPLASVAILGFGNVGRHLATHLAVEGVRLVVADVNEDNVRRAVKEFGATPVSVAELFEADVDAIAPCSIGGLLNERTIPLIRAPIVCGGANNQLERPERDGAALDHRGVLYVPDYIANAGGVISGSAEVLGRSDAETSLMVAGIHDTCIKVFQIADEHGCSPLQAAETLAERILQERPSSSPYNLQQGEHHA